MGSARQNCPRCGGEQLAHGGDRSEIRCLGPTCGFRFTEEYVRNHWNALYGWDDQAHDRPRGLYSGTLNVDEGYRSHILDAMRMTFREIPLAQEAMASQLKVAYKRIEQLEFDLSEARRKLAVTETSLQAGRFMLQDLKQQLERVERSKLSGSPRPDAEMRRRLVQLCHPDKHANSEASQKATRWLLEKKS